MSGKVVVVTNIPRPYRRALFDVLRDQLAAEELELRVLYTSNPTKHARRGSGANRAYDPATEQFVSTLDIRRGYDRVFSIPAGLPSALTRQQPACVVAGGFGPSALLTEWWCRRTKTPLVLWSGAWPLGQRKIGRAEILARRRLVHRASAFIAYGTAAADYLRSLGAPPDRVFCAWNTVDLEKMAAAAHAAGERRAELRSKYSLAEKNLLYVGTVVESKGLREMMAAALAAASTCGTEHGWVLHVVGGGPLRQELEDTAKIAGQEARFRFHGLRPEEDVAEMLGLSDGFILPTKREAWGLVINEAMACGVPVVASRLAGATRDLIIDGVTGFVVDPTDIDSLAGLICRLVSDDPQCREIGRAGAEAVRAKASLAKAAEGFVAAVTCALGRQAGE
jgi:glycosyltransferase involved in cell wall biosynthesis